MSSAILANPIATHTVQVWLSDRSPDSGDAATAFDLTPAERRLADRLTSADRRQAFETARRLGRKAVECRLQTLGKTFSQVEILSEDPTGMTSRPRVCVDGETADLNISITHFEQVVAVAVADGNCPVGIDVARIQNVCQGFAEIWMTDHEHCQVTHSDDPQMTATMNWSAREAAFKATGKDNEFRPGHWSVTFEGDRAICCHRGQPQPVQLSFYRMTSDLLLTVASDGTNVTFCSS